MIKFRKMTEEEFEAFSVETRERYKNDKIRANGFTEEKARKIAEEGFAKILPNGLDSKDNFLFTLVDEKSNGIGHLWYCIRGTSNNRNAFIADIFICEGCRGKGFGRQAMTLLESEVKPQGFNRIGLHVFGFNQPAIKLYKSLGYEVTDLVMEKTLTKQTKQERKNRRR